MADAFWGKKNSARSSVAHRFVDCSGWLGFSKSMCGSVIEKSDMLKRIAGVQPTYLERCKRCLAEKEENKQ